MTPGRYTITVTGTWSINGGSPISHTTAVTVDVTTDFGINVSPSNLNIQAGQQGTFTVTVVSPGYSGTVNLGATVSPTVANSPTVSFGVTSLNPWQFGGTSATTLVVQTSSTTPLGVFVVTVTGTSSSTSHSSTVTVTVVPNDPHYPDQWGLSDLNLPQAWGTTSGTRNRIIAVLDSGIWFDHPDLQANLWTANGFTDVQDGSHGWDYINNGNQPVDDNGHGTEVAGVIASVANNGVGTAGVVQEQLMSVKVCYYNGFCDIGAEAKGIDWAVKHGATVINMSFATSIDDAGLRKAVSDAWKAGVILVASSGNAGELPNPPDPNTGLWYPASYPEVIAVSALQEGDSLWPGSLTGSKVELAAPGHNVWTTEWYPNSTPQCKNMFYCRVNGTSYSAPFVSGLAALVWDYNIQQGTNTLSNQNIRDALDAYVTDLGSSGRDDSFGFGKPNVMSLLGNMVSAHPYTLTARWEWFSSSGTETSARIVVYDGTTGQYVSSDTPLGNNGQVISIPTAHTIGVFFNYYYYDGSHWVYVDHVGGLGGAPTYNDAHSIKCMKYFTFGAVPASDQATYYVGLANNNPYAGTVC